jgi:hypothetical protein
MAITFSDAYKEALLYAPSDVVILETISVEHPDMASIYLVKDYLSFEAYLEDLVTLVEFLPGSFSVKAPTKGSSGVPDISFSIGNTDRQVTDYLESVKLSDSPTELVYRIYLSTDPSGPVETPPLRFQIQDVVVGRLQVSGRAVYARDLKNTLVPKERYTSTRFPGLA